MDRSTEWWSQWISYIAASLYFVAVLLRTLLVLRDSSQLRVVLLLLLIWLILAVSESAISERWRGYFPIYLVIQSILVFILLRESNYLDFYATLLGILSMQAMPRLRIWIGAGWIGICTMIMIVLLSSPYGTQQAIALALIYTAATVFLGSYTLLIQRAQKARSENQALALDLENANQQLKVYSIQLENLAVARERNRLARDLHDSVTQTVFSMTLTIQSAILLMKRDPAQVSTQLERLYQLARNALTEMQVLISELRPDQAAREGLEDALRRYLKDSRFADNLRVVFESDGDGELGANEEEGLFRIAQEGLNNILKHAGISEARIQLHLEAPYWMEIEDKGQGFNLEQAQRGNSVGLASMHERASEIGWEMVIETTPGEGTLIRVEKSPDEEVQR